MSKTIGNNKLKNEVMYNDKDTAKLEEAKRLIDSVIRSKLTDSSSLMDISNSINFELKK